MKGKQQGQGQRAGSQPPRPALTPLSQGVSLVAAHLSNNFPITSLNKSSVHLRAGDKVLSILSKRRRTMQRVLYNQRSAGPRWPQPGQHILSRSDVIVYSPGLGSGHCYPRLHAARSVQTLPRHQDRQTWIPAPGSQSTSTTPVQVFSAHTESHSRGHGCNARVRTWQD